ncbi:zinc finger protein, partial [Aphelenchoides avenae]
MSGVNEKLFSIGCYRRISAQEAECIPCSEGSAEPKRFKTAKYSSSTLIKHLPKHPEYLKKFEDLKKQQPTVTRFLTTPIGSLTAMDRKLLHLVACCNLSFNMINHPTFRTLFAVTKHSEILKDESHYRLRVLPQVYKLVVASIQSHLEHCQFLSFTSDVWSGPCNSFISLTVHGITEEWNRFMFVLAVREFSGSHTAERIEQIVYDLLREWDLDRERVHVILHDQASSMISAFEDSEIEDADCGAHKLNLIVRNSLYPKEGGKVMVTPITTLLALCRSIVTHFRHSHKASDILRQIQKQLNVVEHNLIQDVETRWDSTFFMIDRLLEQKAAINAYCVEHCRRLLLTNMQWSSLIEMRDFLKPLKELNKVLCRDTSSISMQIAVGHAIATELKLYNGEVLKDEIRRMIVIHNNKFVGLEQYRTHAVAHFLDPRFKDKVISDANAASQFRTYTRQCITECANEMAEPEVAIQVLTASPPKKKSFLADLRSKLVGGSSHPNNNASSSQPVIRLPDVEAELNRFMREPLIDWDDDSQA